MVKCEYFGMKIPDKVSIALKIGILFLGLIGSSSSYAVDYFWVGGTGSWSDAGTHWATTSGGAVFHGTPPTTGDAVFFDANSFPSAGTVTLDVNGTCSDFVMGGLTNTATFVGAGTETLTVAGNLTLESADFSGFISTIDLTGLGSISTNGISLVNTDISISSTGTYQLVGSGLESNDIFVNSGTFDLNGQPVDCNTLMSNPLGCLLYTSDAADD